MPMGTAVDRTGTKAPWICQECNTLYHYRGNAPRRRVQLCLCDRRRDEPRWPGHDYNEDERLCGCCCVTSVRSGSRWSRLHCDGCLMRIRMLNEKEGRLVFGVGRHTAMNTVSSGSASAGDHQTVGAALRQAILRAFQAGDERKAWLGTRLQVLRAAADLDDGRDVSLHTLRTRLERAAPALLTASDAFRAMAGVEGIDEEVVASIEAEAEAREGAAEAARPWSSRSG